MAFDAYIKFDGIEGESSDSKHIGWIEITSCDMEINQTISTTASSAGGAGAERADFSDLSFTKLLDKSSPMLAVACADGTHFNTATIELCRSGTEKIKFMEIKLTNSFISSLALSADGDFPSETVTLNYGKIEWKYTQQNRRGGIAAGNVAAGWDLQRNCKV
jgi:type VI secretion system secreted protein Hcp